MVRRRWLQTGPVALPVAQALPWQRRPEMVCVDCALPARRLVFVPTAGADEKDEIRAALAGQHPFQSFMTCEQHSPERMGSLVELDDGLGVAGVRLRMTWRGWWHDYTRLGRLAWKHHLRRSAKIAAKYPVFLATDRDD